MSSREQLVERFEALEQKWKIDCTPEGLSEILSVFNITSMDELVPETVQDVYTTDFDAYYEIRMELKVMETQRIQDQEDGGGEPAPPTMVDLDKRFIRFQESIFYGKETLFSFMRMTNCNSAFPVPSTSDMLFWQLPLNKDDLEPVHMYILYLLGSLFRSRLRKYDSVVFEQIFLGGHATHAWKEKCEIKTIIRILTPKETNFAMWKIMMKGGYDAALKYLPECRDAEFPMLEVKRRVWSFSDGIYNATDDVFTPYGNYIDDRLVSWKIIEKSFAPVYFQAMGGPTLPLSDIATPNFDSIFAPQEWAQDMVHWLFVFVGRLFFAVNERDQWQVIPFLKGIAGTGKSTVIKVIQKLYGARDIGVLSNNMEKQFGASTIFDKKVFIIPEMKGDFTLDVAVFQSMVTGEEVSLAVKHESPRVGKWTVPGIMAGNESPNWQDKSGSISRRVVVFDFPNKVPLETSNPNLFCDIVDSEIPAIIRKATMSYQWAVDHHRNSDIWTVLPARIREEKRKLQFSTNPLFAYVNSDRVDIDPGAYVLESIFISQLKNFISLKFPGVTLAFTPDTYELIFSDYGLRG
ncbi:DNA primase [Feldmannia irregularis virus a]|uniref:FirrV-1-B27 n=2 Tax=root TaxID=1 RepID=Q6XM09_9PHYC|nr:DNA primase [Feldmannia irregularis virus a]AAR26902.1 FirrV-1-B27 [Feldmannia irregularis virus a]